MKNIYTNLNTNYTIIELVFLRCTCRAMPIAIWLSFLGEANTAQMIIMITIITLYHFEA